MEQILSLESVVVVSPNQVSCDLAGEAAVLQMSSGVYYSLNEIGTQIWKLIEQPRSIEDVCEVLLEEFDVDAERCQRSTLLLLEKLLEYELIKVCLDETT